MSNAKWQDASWRTSSHSLPAGTDCVEVAQARDACAVRDSKNPVGTVLTFAPAAWATFLQAIKAGAHDLP
ncbi:DUF397 domain-containing protein [Actinomadura geliboluensis]|uniref:DUF397 domain-containing protein n=1 Tax=Actinomadura geliboluensis TaxID=882440 RepID=UPI00368138A5